MKAPGVYVKEISLFPPSVAEVATAIPAFIGYTEKKKDGIDLKKIGSLVDYEQHFGGPPPISPTVSLDSENNVTQVVLGTKKFFLYDSLRLFFDNGGGKCYIVSVGTYDDSVKVGDDSSGILGGLKKLEKEDEPTIILGPDASLLSTSDLHISFQQQALKQCDKLQDRFLICDLQDTGSLTTDVKNYRDNIGIKYLKYGAAYVPWLQTTFSKKVYFRNIALKRSSSNASLELVNLTRDDDIIEFINTGLKAAIKAVNDIKKEMINDHLTGDNKTLRDQLDSLIATFEEGEEYDENNRSALQEALRNIYTLLVNILHGMVYVVRNSVTDTDTNPNGAELSPTA